jgi:tetratricopeptide (TPR) repeat protein
VDRARLARPDYRVAEHNAAAIADICQQVDGIPLAIEMAAARVHLLSAEQIAGRLNEAFDLLTAGKRTALPRQYTLRATIDWSYQLLSAEEGRLLQRVSVFAGGFTLEAVEAVCSGDGVPVSHVLDLLAGLVSKSMVVAERMPGESSRYRLLEMVRQYAREKLRAAGEAERIHQRHRDHFLAFVEANSPRLKTDEFGAWQPRLAKELDNFRQAIEWSFGDTAHPELCVRLLGSMNLGIGFRHQEVLDASRRWLDLYLGRTDVPASLKAKLLGGTSALTALNDPPAAAELAAQAIEMSRSMGAEGRQTLVDTLRNLASLAAGDLGEPERSVPLLEEAEAVWQELSDEAGGVGYEEGIRASFAYERARLTVWQRRFGDAKAHAADLIQTGEQSGMLYCITSGHTFGGIACLGLGEYTAAREHFRVALDLNRRIQGWEIAYNLRWLAAVDLAEGTLERAQAFCRESLVEAELIPDRNIIASNLGLMAAIQAKRNEPAHAARLSGASAALYARQKRKPWEDSSLDTLLPGWRERADRAEIEAAFEAGQALTSEQAVAYALGVELRDEHVMG